MEDICFIANNTMAISTHCDGLDQYVNCTWSEGMYHSEWSIDLITVKALFVKRLKKVVKYTVMHILTVAYL